MIRIMDVWFSRAGGAAQNAYIWAANVPQYTRPDQSTWYNWGGQNEKWIRGPGSKWYFIKPNGELYLWDGKNDLATSSLVTTLSLDLYEHPEQMINTISDKVYDVYLNGLAICGGGVNSGGINGENHALFSPAKCMFEYLTNTPYGQASIIYDTCPASWQNQFEALGYSLYDVGARNPALMNYLLTAQCQYSVIYLDQFGKAISSPIPGKGICEAGLFQFGTGYVSPISLLWNGQADLETSVESINYDIDASGKKKPIIWRGSAEQPLLVYDPEHTGEILDAQQLFGNWTFGGKVEGIVSVSLNSETDHKRKPWSDGFEVLATLDANKNGKVDGPELDPLGIWFDYNRNGISEAGEVISASNAEVTALYYKVDRREGKTNDAYVSHGFDRLRFGKLLSGTAVDWHTSTNNSPEKLVSEHLGQSVACADSKYTGSQANPSISVAPATAGRTAELASQTSAQVSDQVLQLSGAWMWSRTDFETNPHEKKRPQGFLMFDVDKSGLISGHSYSQLKLQNAGKADSMLGIYQLFGKIAESIDGQTNFTFEIVAPDGGTVKSSAVLFEGGTKIKGETVATVTYEKMMVNTSYQWVAERLPELVKNYTK